MQEPFTSESLSYHFRLNTVVDLEAREEIIAWLENAKLIVPIENRHLPNQNWLWCFAIGKSLYSEVVLLSPPSL